MSNWNPKVEPFRVAGTYKMAAPIYWAQQVSTHATLELADAQALVLVAKKHLHTVKIDRVKNPDNYREGWVPVRTVKLKGRVL